ncbi:hypothetical protein HIM_06920 [Hirsutella minnesotensis 3608]|uniref:WW domain-containing protein n=1 Tax=Hirsutella minnesotensis 3608 TaxID=1043627 RepID=A0A0F7ZZ89_9HYPO|nr:hypothetical protein HIM_06920 [Hirsutella minnesotensis 3608]
MLKSTYKPSPAALAAAAATAPLPPGWTEHKAPTGHSYYYNAETKESTYKRPGAPVIEPAPAPAEAPAPVAHVPNLSDPRVANAYLAQFNPQPRPQGHDGPGGRGGYQGRPRPQPIDKPRRKEAIPGCEPWILVYTKYSRRFVYNPVKNASYWRIPEKLMPGILELDKARLRGKASQGKDEDKPDEPGSEPAKQAQADHADDSSEYEEVEVTDEEDEDLDDDHRSKRQRTGDSGDDGEEEQGALEFTEADIAAQLQMMGDDYGLEPGDYDDGNMEAWPEGTEGVEFSEEDAKCLFKDLLNDFNINPYSPWDKLIEEGKIIDDPRYTALSTMRARKDCWDEWSREKIAELKEQRAKQEKKDPKIAYMAFLQEKATPKLYWPEFKRKYKKEDSMKDLKLSDKDREKAYREHINRLKLPQATLKSDLTALLRAQPTHLLHNKSLSSGLPSQVLTDVRYISLQPQVRDALVEAYVQTLPPPPEDEEAAGMAEERRKEREARDRRQRALEERNRAVEEQKRKREREVAVSKARLREGEREIEMAMRVDKRGLQGQLAREHTGEQEAPPATDSN